MLLKINNKPFITLDEHIDINSVLDLRDDFYFMVSTLWPKTRTGVMHAGGADIDNLNTIFREKDALYFAQQRTEELRKTDKDLDQKLSYFESNNDRTGLIRYLKLKYRCFDPYNLLQIRTTEKPLYSADGLTFTEDDWKSYYWIDEMEKFSNIKTTLENLPFKNIGTVTFFVAEHYVPLGYHRDFNYFPYKIGNQPDTFPHRQEMIWFRFELDRPFYLFDIEDNQVVESVPLKGYSAFYNHHNWHGNLESNEFTSLTMKVEGEFTEEFRKKIGIDNLEYYYK